MCKQTETPIGEKFIEQEESLRLTVYRDSRGLPTVGWGHLVHPADGLKVGDTITQQEAEDFLAYDLAGAVHTVQHAVSVDVTDNQFAALTSLCFNIGSGAFASSTLIKKLNAGDVKGASQEFLRWDYAGGIESNGLLNRRKRETQLFLTPDSDTSGQAAPSAGSVAATV